MSDFVGAINSNICANTGVAISMAITKKTLDIVQEQGAMMLQELRAMELSVNPNVGANFDAIV